METVKYFHSFTNSRTILRLKGRKKDMTSTFMNLCFASSATTWTQPTLSTISPPKSNWELPNEDESLELEPEALFHCATLSDSCNPQCLLNL